MKRRLSQDSRQGGTKFVLFRASPALLQNNADFAHQVWRAGPWEIYYSSANIIMCLKMQFQTGKKACEWVSSCLLPLLKLFMVNRQFPLMHSKPQCHFNVKPSHWHKTVPCLYPIIICNFFFVRCWTWTGSEDPPAINPQCKARPHKCTSIFQMMGHGPMASQWTRSKEAGSQVIQSHSGSPFATSQSCAPIVLWVFGHYPLR